jgi:hypothetical protein
MTIAKSLLFISTFYEIPATMEMNDLILTRTK